MNVVSGAHEVRAGSSHNSPDQDCLLNGGLQAIWQRPEFAYLDMSRGQSCSLMTEM